MKLKLLTYCSFTFLMFVNSLWAQSDVTQQFESLISASDHKGVSDLCSDFVEIETDRYEETTSKSQVGFVLREFFTNHPPKSFGYSHVGTSPGGAKYAIATYVSNQGKHFLVVVKFKVHGSKLLIDTMKFTLE